MDFVNFFLSLLYAYVACFGFGIIFHLRGKLLFITPIGGVLLWGAYLLLENFSIIGVIERSFIATMVAAIFCEIVARLLKVPVTVFMIIAILPLVPGSGIYYSMLACIQKDYEKFLSTGIETIGIAGAIAVGMLLVSSVFRMYTTFKRKKAG